MSNKKQILIVDDEVKIRRILQIILRNQGFRIDLAEDGSHAWRLFQEKPYNLVITDLKMPGMDGMELMQRIVKKNSDIPVVVITAYGSVASAVNAMKNGAFDYITKPFENDEIRLTVDKALTYSGLKDEVRFLRKAVGAEYPFNRFIGDSPEISKVRKLAAQVARTNSTVLVQGESGTGKELIARLIHFNSARAAHPFIAFNCGALPTHLLESELFGYEEGAFTGARKRKPGRFELAHKGTIFLDEIGDMSPELQVKMLRVLEERTFERLGGTRSLEVDTRVIAATHRDLGAMVEKGTFRADLYYRLNIFPIHIPPLRKHKADLHLLAERILFKLAEETGKRVRGLSPEGMAQLLEHTWPGNVRELQNCLERAMILCCGETIITPEELIIDPVRTPAAPTPLDFVIPDDGISLEAMERNLIRKALGKVDGNQSRAAALLRISRNTLRYRMEKYGLLGGA